MIEDLSVNVQKRIGVPDPIDVHVGYRLRLRRNLAGISQEQLGKASDLTFQQIQKYERGINRMGASRLFRIARILDVSVSYFFDEMPQGIVFSDLYGFSDNEQEKLDGTPDNDKEVLYGRETLELVRAYHRIVDAKQRRRVLELIKSMADDSDTSPNSKAEKHGSKGKGA